MITDRQIMNALAVILPGYPTVNTRLGQLNNPILIEQEFSALQGKFPILLLEPGQQKHTIIGGPRVYSGILQVIVTYIDRYDTQNALIDTIRSQIDVDLQQMMQNVMQNPTLAVDGIDLAQSITEFQLSEYKGELDDKTIPGLTTVKRILTMTVSILPYDM